MDSSSELVTLAANKTPSTLPDPLQRVGLGRLADPAKEVHLRLLRPRLAHSLQGRGAEILVLYKYGRHYFTNLISVTYLLFQIF